MTMFWQEFYGDWAAYLIYNPKLTRLPWGPSKFTTPYKPLYLVFAYGWFYVLIFMVLMIVLRWVRKQRPSWGRWPTLFGVTLVVYYIWNFVGADGTSFVTNYYRYVHPIGPAVGVCPRFG